MYCIRLWEALVLGILQGIGEFLPISSSGHLRIAMLFLDIAPQSHLALTIALHVSTGASIIVYFFGRIKKLLGGIFHRLESRQLLGYLLLSALPAGILGIFFQDWIFSWYKGSLGFVGWALCVNAGILWCSRNKISGQRRIGLARAFGIGLAQALAIIPGISRSGITISTGLIMRVEKGEAISFSFLMALLPIFGGGILEIWGMWHGQTQGVRESALWTGNELWVVLLASGVAFLSGLWACRHVIRWVERGKWHHFAIYCLLVGLACVIFSYGFQYG